MATTLIYSRPSLFIPEGTLTPNPRKASAGSGHSGNSVIMRNDFVLLSSGVLSRAATSAGQVVATAGFYGLTVVSEYEVFKGTDVPPYANQVFGFSQVGTLLPADPGQIPVYSFVNNEVFVEINLTNTTGWVTGGTNQATLGSTGGLYLDASTNIFVLDVTNSTHAYWTIYSKPQGVPAAAGGPGDVGDLGARVVVYCNTLSVLV